MLENISETELTQDEIIQELRYELAEVHRIHAEQLAMLVKMQDIHRGEEMQRAAHREHELMKLATVDQLTGLLNRNGFFQHTEAALSYAARHHTPLGFILADIDKFKDVNDRFGHPVGDHVIAGVASCLQISSRKEDIVARWGGEEYMLMAPITSLNGLHIMAERFRARVLQMNVDGIIGFSVSVGCALFDPVNDMIDVIKRADEALYTAKQNGRNRTAIDPHSMDHLQHLYPELEQILSKYCPTVRHTWTPPSSTES